MKLKNKKSLIRLYSFSLLTLIVISSIISFTSICWNTIDYQANDVLYRLAVKNNKGPKWNDQIVHLNITDKSYSAFHSNYLRRNFLADLNYALSKFSPSFVFYDFIFTSPSVKEEDSLFVKSMQSLNKVFLPAAFRLKSDSCSFRGVNSESLTDFYKRIPQSLIFNGLDKPRYADIGIFQNELFRRVNYKSGHISLIKDADGKIRHCPLFIKIDSVFVPAISLALFLDYNEIDPKNIHLNSEKSIEIDNSKNKYLKNDIVIPIDNDCTTLIPYPWFWNDTKAIMIDAQDLLDSYDKQVNYANLLNLLEGKFIFVSDISAGSSDLGEATLEDDLPLVTIHSSVFNALLENEFYSKWSPKSVGIIVFLFGILTLIGSSFKSNLPFFLSAIILILFMPMFAYLQLVNHQFFPVFTAFSAVFIFLIISVITQYLLSYRDRAFITKAFSKYVSPKIVESLIEDETKLRLEGEERNISILFADIEEFTSLSEFMETKKLVDLLNDYLSEMTSIIIQNDGLVDKFIGDAILAEFGAPIFSRDHAESAVRTALIMSQKLKEMNVSKINTKEKIRTRIGINTGQAIIGNIGTKEIFNYTAIGDSVNLASRLESLNKLYGTNLLISEYTYDSLDLGKYHIRLIDKVYVKGKTIPINIYEVYGFSEEKVLDNYRSYIELYDKGLESYLKKDIVNSLNYFKKSLLSKPSDKASILFIDRIKNLAQYGFPPNWNGSHKLYEK